MEKRLILSLIVGVTFVCTSNGQNGLHPLVGNTRSDVVLVEQSPGNDHELFPDTYAIWFYHQGEPMYIDLLRDDSMTDSLSPSLFQLSKYLPNELMNENNKNEFAFYHNKQDVDSGKRAHFVLHRPGLSRPANVYGQINHDGYMYTLQSTGKANEHRIRRDTSLAEHRGKRAIEGNTYIVEIVVWTAPDLFQFHKNRLSLTNSETAVWMETFRAALMRDVDLTFRKVSTVDIRCMYVGGGDTTKTTTSWFNNNYQDPYLADKDTLADVTSFLQGKIGGDIPSYDHAIVLTRADLAKNKNGDKAERQAVTTGSICADNAGSSVSIAEVSSPFYRKIVAQAIGLGFGLKYQFGSDIYTVMARDNPTFPVPNNNKDDLFLFGNSRDTELAATITGFGNQCLQNSNIADYDAFIKGDKIGTTYTNDEQCDVLYGSGSVVCSGASVPTSTCFSDVKCKVLDTCGENIILGQESECDAANKLGCSYSACSFQLEQTSSSSSTSSSSTSSTTSSTATTTASSSTTSSTATTTASSSTTSSTASTTASSTSTTGATTTSSMLPSSTPSSDCCCEKRPLGEVKINIEYIPCPGGNPDNKYIID